MPYQQLSRRAFLTVLCAIPLAGGCQQQAPPPITDPEEQKREAEKIKKDYEEKLPKKKE